MWTYFAGFHPAAYGTEKFLSLIHILTFNTIGRHISKMVYTKVVSNKSPWLQKAQLGGVYCNPASHGEGRFVANDEWLAKLFANGQVATQYVTPVSYTHLTNPGAER